MKNILLLSMVVLGLTSCSKDSLDQNLDQLNLPVKSAITVRVSILKWTNHESGCGNNSSQEVTLISNAKVDLYDREQNDTDAQGTSMMTTRTDNDGSANFSEIEPAVYTVWVETSMGKKSRTVTTQLHRRSYIDFSF